MKNLTIFRSGKDWKPNFELLNNNLSVDGKLGYAWKVIRDNSTVITVGNNHLITCEKQGKLLPDQVVEKELKSRIDQIEKDQGYKVGKKQKRDLKEQIIETLFVKAFTVSKLVNVWINTEHDLLCIETTSTNVADEVIKRLIRDLEWRGRLLVTDDQPQAFMRKLIMSNDMCGITSEGSYFDLGKSCILQSHDGKKITYKNMFLTSNLVTDAIAIGNLPVKMDVVFVGGEQKCAFSINDSCVISKITLPDITTEDVESETENDRFDAEFTIRTGQCIKLINELIAVLGEKEIN
jgi:recombination associated protein RdgC